MGERLNLVFYAPSYDSLGGGEIWLNRVTNELRRRGHRVTVIGKRPPVSPVDGDWEPGIERHYLLDTAPTPEVGTGLASHVATLAASPTGRRLDRAVRGWRPAGTFVGDIPSDAHARLVQLIEAARDAGGGLRTVVVCSDVYTASHLASAVNEHRLAVAFVIVHHLSFASLTEGTRRALQRAAVRAVGLVALTEEDAVGFRRAGFDRVDVVPNPNLDSPDEPDPSARERVAVWLGRMTTQKSVHLAVETWSRIRAAHPDWQLRLYGDGPERGRVEQRIAILGLGEVVTLAGVTDDTDAVYRAASLNLLPSQFEGWGLVIGEAGRHGVPTLAFDCAPGVRAQIEHRVSGLLVPVNDVEGFARELDTVLGDPGLRGQLGAGARVKAAQFSLGRVGARWEAILQRASGAG